MNIVIGNLKIQCQFYTFLTRLLCSYKQIGEGDKYPSELELSGLEGGSFNEDKSSVKTG